LLHLITEVHGTAEQRLEFLQDPCLGPESKLAKGEWQLWRFKLQLLTRTGQWKELYEVTSSLLKRARTKDATGHLGEERFCDWIVWEGILKSAIELGQIEFVTHLVMHSQTNRAI